MNKYFFIREGGRYVKINFHEILYLEGRSNYVRIVTSARVFMALITMKKLEMFLPGSMFCRIHKSFIVSKDHIIEFDSTKVQLHNINLPIGEVYWRRLLKSVLRINAEMNSEAIIAPFMAEYNAPLAGSFRS